MKIVFIGAVQFSLESLNHLVNLDAEVVGVCTLEHSEINSDHVDLMDFCVLNEIPCVYINDINSIESITWIKEKSPDIIFCFGWSKLIKRELLRLAPLGIIGFHPAALPANKGRHPIVWALVLGLEKTASTFFLMDDSVDGGDIISQEELLIESDDDANTLYEKIVSVALIQISNFLPEITKGVLKRIKQDENHSNIWRKRGVQDGRIDWRMSALSIHNLVRGLTKPYVGAHFLLNGKEIKVWKTSPIFDVPNNIEPGKVMLHLGEDIVIKCGEGAISLTIAEVNLKDHIGSYL